MLIRGHHIAVIIGVDGRRGCFAIVEQKIGCSCLRIGKRLRMVLVRVVAAVALLL